MFTDRASDALAANPAIYVHRDPGDGRLGPAALR